MCGSCIMNHENHETVHMLTKKIIESNISCLNMGQIWTCSHFKCVQGQQLHIMEQSRSLEVFPYNQIKISFIFLATWKGGGDCRLHAGACRFISFLLVLMHEKCFHGAFQISWINWLHCIASATSYVIKTEFFFPTKVRKKTGDSEGGAG